MKRIWICLVPGLILPLLAAAPAHAAIEIRRINFNPDGRDTGTNSHINQEWILLKNTGTRSVNLQGWKLHDAGRDHVYRFGNWTLEPGARFELRSGRGAATVSDTGDLYFYWGLANYVWNNAGDVASLRNRSGKVVDRCRYGSSTSSPKRC